MVNFEYLITHFFTHKDYLVPAENLPGTIYTPMQLIYTAVVFAIVVGSAWYVSKRKDKIPKVFAALWVFLVAFEVVIVAWDSLAGMHKGLDLQTGLSLYPCSLFLYTMPFAIWGKGIWKKMACGYVCTLGLLGAAVNFLYPIARLSDYSCISFASLHTFTFHGSMLFACMVMLKSGYFSYRAEHLRELFYPCIPSLLLSIPANLINYSHIDADYMYFRGKMPVVAMALPGFSEIGITVTLYALYILIPALFFLPSFLLSRKRACELEEIEEEEECMALGFSY